MACAVALGAAGCGSSAPASKPTAAVSIATPLSGATIGTRNVTVTGSVTPANATVTVAGLPATVVSGRFTRQLSVTTPTQLVTVSAVATGYQPGYARTTINFSSHLATQIAAAQKALVPLPAPTTRRHRTAGAPSSAGAGALSSAVALPPAPAPHSSPTPTPTTPSSTTPTTTTPSSPGATTPTSSSRPAKPAKPIYTAARIRHLWDGGCLKATRGTNVRPYCSCLYTRLLHTGVFKSPRTVAIFVRRVRRSSRTNNISMLSARVRTALFVCATKLPASVGLGGSPTVTRLGSQSHDPVTAPPTVSPPLGTPATPTGTGTTPTPTVPAPPSANGPTIVPGGTQPTSATPAAVTAAPATSISTAIRVTVAKAELGRAGTLLWVARALRVPHFRRAR